MRTNRRTLVTAAAMALIASGISTGIAIVLQDRHSEGQATLQISPESGESKSGYASVTEYSAVQPSAAQPSEKRIFTKEVSSGAIPTGQVAYDILKREQPLMDTQTLHRAAIRTRETVRRAQTHLGNAAQIESWAADLKARPRGGDDADILRRAYLIDALQEAAAWKENPARLHVVAQVRNLVTSLPDTDADATQLKILAVEKRELWRIMKFHFTESERAGMEKDAIETAWEQHLTSLTKDEQ